MDKKILAMAIGVGISSQFPDTPPMFNVSKGSTGNKYKPHQGKKECERRLKRLPTPPSNEGEL
jgi:hypothetical protein